MEELDSNLILHYARASELSRQVEARYGFFASGKYPLVSVVTEAEVRAIASANQWGLANLLRLERVLSQCIILPIPYRDSVDQYVEVENFSRQRGRKMGQNDMWIAAAAIVTGATLFTTDKDFEHLDPTLLTYRWIDPTI